MERTMDGRLRSTSIDTHYFFTHKCVFSICRLRRCGCCHICACPSRVQQECRIILTVPNVVCPFGSFSKRSSGGWLGTVQEYHQPYSFLLYRISHCHEASCCTETVVREETVLQTLLEPRGGSFLTQPHSGAGLSTAHCHASGFHKPFVAVHGSRLEVAPR